MNGEGDYQESGVQSSRLPQYLNQKGELSEELGALSSCSFRTIANEQYPPLAGGFASDLLEGATVSKW